LHSAELSFNRSDGPRYVPEKLIHELGGVIEALSRKVWTLSPGEKVGRVLHEKAARGATTLEKRFAAIALPLYVQYRNSAEHEPNTFRCEAYETRHFLTGIQALYGLEKQIRAERNCRGG
jgi:hypothetical protein